MIKIKRLFTYTVANAALISASLATQAETVRLGHVTPPSHIWHKVADRFNRNLQQASGNEDTVKIYPLGKLGGDDQMIDLLQSGAMQMAILAAGSLSTRSDSMNAWFMPYTFSDVTDAATATQSETARKLLTDLSEHKLVGLGYTLAGMRHVISSSPINSADDFQNKKIRSFPNQVFNDWWKGLNAAPTALPLSDVSSALTTNLLDGVDVDLDIVVGLKMYQQAPYLTVTNHMAFPGVMVASEKWWNSLTKDKREKIIKAFKEAEQWGFEQQAMAEISNLEKLRQAGVTVTEIDQTELRALGADIVKQYSNQSSDIANFYNQNAQ